MSRLLDSLPLELRPALLTDAFGRTITNLRVSVTDRCNFRCLYCMPAEGLAWLPRSEVLTFEEIERLVGIAARLGVRRVRLTGGEPLLRREIEELVKRLLAVPGVEDLSLTTNGFLLARLVRPLARAGLSRINVSVDSLVRERFAEITRRDALGAVMEGLFEAARILRGPIKVNAVIVRGFNDGEVVDFARLARDEGMVVRFIEYMPLDADGSWRAESVVPGSEIRRRIEEEMTLIPLPTGDGEPSVDYVIAGSRGRVGFINSVTEPFCDRCNRIRLTADGRLRTCLFSVTETDLRGPLRNGASDVEIAGLLVGAVLGKEPGHRIGQPDFVRASRSMSQIGG